jgi:hypothetical protein
MSSLVDLVLYILFILNKLNEYSRGRAVFVELWIADEPLIPENNETRRSIEYGLSRGNQRQSITHVTNIPAYIFWNRFDQVNIWLILAFNLEIGKYVYILFK